ncbi:Serine/threonine protein kinase [Rhodopirellula islandica]|uniref:Serine/threonine protein kinase n=1 Tax=Rhodopirellula islandica TaxID=595434 RepID=A0A0J1E9H7_RHOIS|nr:protein kinase [Rhodopirellula islandica]KLU02119.1 Serine/threonine protein kinase [Rhodopirellula islandica]
MMTATECPSIERLKDLTLGRLAEEDSDSMLDHLRDCEVCQSELETIGDGEDSLIQAIRSPDDASEWILEPQCDVAVIAALGVIGIGQQSPAVSEMPGFPVSIGEYEIVRPLGRGGMGNVYLARHTKLGRLVALKVLAGHRLADAKMKERFEAEMRAVGQLSHPGIVTAHDAREIDGTAVLITEFIDGMDLAQLVSRTGPIGVADACDLIRQVAVALQYTSDQGFVHRDVKPSNIMLSHSGEVKLLDLGLARLQEPRHETSGLTGTGQAMGTADYIAPEQVTDSRGVDVRADIYSLGCTLFKLLTGQAPFAGPQCATAFAKMTAHVSSPPPVLRDFLPDAPAGLNKFVASMLGKDPTSRPQTPMQVAEKLKLFVSDANLAGLIARAETASPERAPASHPETKVFPKTQSWRRRTVSLTAAIAAGFLGLFIGLMSGLLIRIKMPDGSIVTVNAPDGSEVSIVPEVARDLPSENIALPAVAGFEEQREEAFLKFAILATEEEMREYGSKYEGLPQDFAATRDGFRWYAADPDADLSSPLHMNGKTLHLVREVGSLAIDQDKLREEIDMAKAKGTSHIDLRLSNSAGQALRKLTASNMRRKLAIIVNGKIRMAPTIMAEVGRDIAITGRFTQEEIRFLMAALSSGLVTPLSKQDRGIQTKSDLERLQGVWRLSGRSDATLLAFDGRDFYIADDQSIRAAGHIAAMTSGDGDLREVLFTNLITKKSAPQLLVYRFLIGDRLEFESKRSVSANSNVLGLDAGKGFFIVERLGDFPTDADEVVSLSRRFRSMLARQDSQESGSYSPGVVLPAVTLLMNAKTMGMEAVVKAVGKIQAAERDVQSTNQLKQMGIAFHNFASAYRKFPASASMAREGAIGINDQSELKPFSWRVAILPFIEQQELFEQYRFDEPWDSDANLKLLPKMPSIYRRPDAPEDQPVGQANYQGIANGASALGIDDGVKFKDIRDGLANTLLILETKSSVPWTKPQDLSELPEFADDAVLRYLMADGAVRTMDPVDEEKLKALITRDGGEQVEP